MATRARRWSGDRGMVTLELAACLPVLVLVLLAALGAIAVAGAQVRATDAAREAARLAARGDAGAVALARAVAPGARVDIRADGTDVVAVVHLRVALFAGRLPGIEVSASAVAASEPR